VLHRQKLAVRDLLEDSREELVHLNFSIIRISSFQISQCSAYPFNLPITRILTWNTIVTSTERVDGSVFLQQEHNFKCKRSERGSKGQLLLVINSCPQQNRRELINEYPRKQSLRNIKVGDAYQYGILFFQDEDIIHISHLTRDMSAAFSWIYDVF